MMETDHGKRSRFVSLQIKTTLRSLEINWRYPIVIGATPLKIQPPYQEPCNLCLQLKSSGAVQLANGKSRRDRLVR